MLHAAALARLCGGSQNPCEIERCIEGPESLLGVCVEASVGYLWAIKSLALGP